MGGIQIDDASRVLSPSGAVPGLFACGEMAGGAILVTNRRCSWSK
jgi:succinate dehydrogenase/fumarate reductase flavoprotein subunit